MGVSRTQIFDLGEFQMEMRLFKKMKFTLNFFSFIFIVNVKAIHRL